MKFTLFSILLLILWCYSPIKAQTSFKSEFNSIKQLEKVLSEKVHLHIDRSVFSTGEDIWFKAYLMEGTLHVLSQTSHNLHVDIVSSKGVIVDSKIILLHNGAGYGDIHIDKNKYTEGVYQIRAYTNFMRNFGEDVFFTQNIIIKENIESKKLEKESNEAKIDLVFFPEGGNLVESIVNRVAFKATNLWGRGENIKINIYDQNDKLIQQTATQHSGMGVFNLKAVPNTKYYALIDSIGFDQKKIYLPNATKGYSIFVGNQFKNILDFQINTTPNNVKKQAIKYTIQSRGVLFASNKVIIDKQENYIRIEKDKLPEGISVITVYNEHDIPVCERLIFNQNFKKIQIKIHTNKQEYEAREKIQISIETRDENGLPTPTNLSLAVIDKYIKHNEKKFGVENTGIIPSVLLNADLKGKIEDPAFYFQDFDIKKHYLLDLVLLTHGWRKYVWKEIVKKDTLLLAFDYEKGFTFSGKVKKLLSKKAIPDSKVTLAMVENGITFHESKSDTEGRFRFDNVYIMDTTTVVFQAYNQRDKRKTLIELDNNRYIPPQAKAFQTQNTLFESTELDYFTSEAAKMIKLREELEAKKNILLGEVTVNAKKLESDGHFRIYKQADHVIEVDDVMESYPDIFSMIRSRLPGIQIMGACPEVQVIIRGFSSMTGDNSAGYILDGMFVDTESMCSVVPFNVDKIEVLNSTTAAIYGSRGANGILAVYTKKGPDRKVMEPVGIEKKKQNGYYRAREFYVPNYDKPSEELSGADIRNTLFWEPFISTNAEGKAQISFFNADKKANYNIKIEGVGLKGGIGESTSEFEVVSKEY